MKPKKTRINRIIGIYIYMFFVYMMISRIIPISSLIVGKLDSFISSGFAGVGILLLGYDFISERIMFKSKKILVLVAFIVVQVISSLISFKFGVVDNIKTIVWTSIHIFLIYSFFVRYGKKDGIELFKRIFNTMNVIWTIGIVISLGQFFMQIGYLAKENAEHLVRQGFIDNRLFGIFLDPNFASIASLCFVFYCIFAYEQTNKLWVRRFYIFSIIVQYLYIVLSGSRTVLICLYVAMLIFLILNFRNDSLKKKEPLKKCLKNLFIVLFISSMAFVGLYVVSRQVLPQLSFEIKLDKEDDQKNKDKIKEELLHRKDVQEGNVLNNRSMIWREYLKCLKGKDCIFGLSPRNALKYIDENYPNSYLTITQYRAHSDYVGILIYTGLAGCIAILLFAIYVLKNIIKHMKYKTELSKFYIMSVTIGVSLSIYAAAFLDIFFVNTLTAVTFWIIISALMNDELAVES